VSPTGVLTFSLSLPVSYDTHGEIVDFQRQLVGALRGLPGVTAAGAADLLPMAGDGGGDCVAVRTRGTVAGADRPCAVRVTATPGYTESLGMGVRGGTLSWNDPSGVLVTASLAERLWPGEDPVGRQFTSGDGSATWRVDGVIDIIRPVVLDPPADAFIVSVDGVPDAAARLRAIVVTVRTDGPDPLALIPAVRRVVARLEPAVAIANARSMDAVERQATLPFTIIFGVIGFWAAACLLLAAVGTWGVVSHVAGRRTKEIAIRLALGARPGDVRRAVAGRTFRLTGIGAVTGIAAAAVVTRVLEAMLHGVDPLDPGVFVTVAAIVCGSAFVAGWIPTRRAMRVNLRDALHAD
jgi:hypothetical protein